MSRFRIAALAACLVAVVGGAIASAQILGSGPRVFATKGGYNVMLCGAVPNEGRVTLAALNLHALAASVDLAVYDWQPSDLLATGGALV